MVFPKHLSDLTLLNQMKDLKLPIEMRLKKEKKNKIPPIYITQNPTNASP
jgi:hypothetical protein